MNKSVLYALFVSAIICFSTISNVFGQAFPVRNSTQQYKSNFDGDKLLGKSNELKTLAFSNPTVFRFEEGCTTSNLNSKKFSSEIKPSDRAVFCEALQEVANQLNSNKWSEELGWELQQIWEVFNSEDIKIRPMKKGVSSRIAASAEAYIPNSTKGGFYGSLYLRPESAKSSQFFIVSMHELRHIYDFYNVWKMRGGITKAELEKRGFRLMGKIARETPQKESFWRLPRLWSEDWRELDEKEISNRMEAKIVRYMAKSRFYKNLIKYPSREVIGFKGDKPNRAFSNMAVVGAVGKGARLPYLVKTKQSKDQLAQGIQEISFEIVKAKDQKNSDEILTAALKNEKSLYYKMDNFVYDQDLRLNCWKKQKISERYMQTRQVARTEVGKPLFERENIVFQAKKKKLTSPSCLLNMDSIDTDSTETFWSAPYLDEMPIKFVNFTELDGVKVARYTVYKPSIQKFNEMAAKYPFINPFRVFFGSIFISVEDAQIVKFWGSSFPEAKTTGQTKDGVLASYNATAIRQKLSSGIWVTTKLNTVAVANKKGKMKPFSYTVDYKNYRQAATDVLILDDDETVAGLNN